MEHPVALITGANKGIGLETARQLGSRGCIIWLGARDPELGRMAAQTLASQGTDVRFVQIDVTSDASVRAALSTVTELSGRLDILVNNAGITAGGRVVPSALEIDAIKTIYEVNVFGAIRVTQAFLPLLRQSTAGRIVMVSSRLGSLTLHTDPADPLVASNLLGYNSSKSALNAVTVAFAKELSGTSIKVNAADPGYTATDLNGHSGTQTVDIGATSTVELALLPDDGPTGGYFSKDGSVPW